jgi:protein-tyrosine-phosphatase
MLVGRRSALAALGLASVAACKGAPRGEAERDTVVFVCEHGSAKSVIAARHFERLAARRGLKVRAVARGVTPDEALPARVRGGLEADGLGPGEFTPRRFEPAEGTSARRVVVIGDAALPGERVRVEHWREVPAVSADYGAARDAIVRQIEGLLDRLEREGG